MGYKFRPISVHNKAYKAKTGISRKRQPFNDKRLYNVYQELSEQIDVEQSVCVQQITDDSAQARSFYRFYGNQSVEIQEVIKMNCKCTTDLSDTEVLSLGDSTSFNLSKRSKRIKDFHRLGLLQGGKTKGFHAHASLALNAQSGGVIGLTDVMYWHRKGKKYEYGELPKSKRESRKWYLGADNTAKVLSDAKRITYVFDREADDFDLFKHISYTLKRDLLIRANHNRYVLYDGERMKLKTCLAVCPLATTYEVRLKALDHYSWTHGKRIKRAARTAKLELRYAKLKVFPPNKKHLNDEEVELTAIHVKEVTEDLTRGEKPLEWILWTTHDIQTVENAIRCVEYYLLRWNIEQLFRIMKRKGFDIEATQLETVDAILKQTTMAFAAATKVMQLVRARNQQDDAPIDYVFDEQQQIVLNKVNERVEGKTQQQKNPFPSDKLSWGAWIIARLGGWKGYQSAKPPGPITMKRGLDRFYAIFEGYQIFNTS